MLMDPSARAPKVPEKKDPEPVDVPFLLPHEVIDELSRAGSIQVGVAKNGSFKGLMGSVGGFILPLPEVCSIYDWSSQ